MNRLLTQSACNEYNWQALPANQSHYFYWPNTSVYGIADKVERRDLQLGSCSKLCNVRAEGLWLVNKVGPFITTGGYDWHQVHWKDLGYQEVQDHFGKDIQLGLHSFLTIPTGTDGVPLAQPPIHVHHHKINERGLDLIFHGGDPCENAGELDCFAHDLRQYAFEVSDLSYFALLNDVRVPQSSSMVWFFNVALRIAPMSAIEMPAVSTHELANPIDDFMANFMHLPGPLRGTFFLPPREDSFIVYTGMMPHDGMFLPGLTYLHTHFEHFYAAIMFQGDVDELGFEYLPRKPWVPVLTHDVFE